MHMSTLTHIHQQKGVRFWQLWVISTEWKCCHDVMVEAEGHLKLISTSTLHIYKLFEHIDMLCIGIQ